MKKEIRSKGVSYYKCRSFKFIREYIDNENFDGMGRDLAVQPRFRVVLKQDSQELIIDNDEDLDKLITLLQGIKTLNKELTVIDDARIT